MEEIRKLEEVKEALKETEKKAMEESLHFYISALMCLKQIEKTIEEIEKKEGR